MPPSFAPSYSSYLYWIGTLIRLA
ncbi:MAG: hypothetical protein H6Q10_2232, partial [Acidobacteria bacterium]|nr:hypothetical protein [Acidobacteriota bacterium]